MAINEQWGEWWYHVVNEERRGRQGGEGWEIKRLAWDTLT